MFQFHNGSIKRRKILPIVARIMRFNSTMVRLKVMDAVAIPASFWCFNSTMVRLKVISMPITKPITEEFQFHNGSIKSRFDYNTCPITLLFQFHNGSIKSRTVANPDNILRFGFNSTMVRLKGWEWWDSDGCLSSFNSTMVRLKGLQHRQRWRLCHVSIPQWFD